MRPTSAWTKALETGLATLTPIELLTLAVTRDERDVATTETEVRQAFGDYQLPHYRDLSPADLHRVAGLEAYEAGRVLAALELGRRIGLATQGERATVVANSKDAYEVFRNLADEKQEHFCAAFFDSKGALITRKTIHIGTLNMSVVGAREVFREAVRHNAASVIVAHNHPSGDPTPSPEDVRVTRMLKEAGELLDVPVLDHLVIGHNGRYTSLQERGML